MVLIAGDIYKLGVRFWQLNFEFHKNKRITIFMQITCNCRYHLKHGVRMMQIGARPYEVSETAKGIKEYIIKKDIKHQDYKKHSAKQCTNISQIEN